MCQYPVFREGVVKQGYLIVVLLVLISICSCGEQLETPIQAVKEMKSLACAGNVKGFYSYVDKVSVEKNFKKMTLQRMRRDTIYSKSRKNLDPYGVREMIEVVIPNLMILKWAIMSQELKLGKEGSLCNMEVVREIEGANIIKLKFSNGKRSAWGFEKGSGALTLVSILDREPFDFIHTDWGLTPIVEKPLQKRAESIAVAKNDDEEHNNRRSVKKDSNDRDLDDMPTLYGAGGSVKPDSTVSGNVPSGENMELESGIEIEEPEAVKDILAPDESTEEDDERKATRVSVGSYDFGRARWGMNKELVISAEGSKPLLKKGDMLKYKGIYQGMGAELTYTFSNNRLVKGRYKLIGNSADEMAYIRNYLRIKELLSLRFGEPQIDEKLWANSSYKDNPESYGFAVYIGHLSYRSKWSTMRTEVLLELKSGNYDMLLEALYYSN